MSKFIFTVTSAAAIMLGQVYNEQTMTVTEAKAGKTAAADSTYCSAKAALRLLVLNKKQMPS